MNRERIFLLSTAFLEGLSVLIIEIAGARALAPYFGASLKVWTAQITGTLLFLAAGYGLGGILSRAPKDWKLPVMFWASGLWLALFPLLRAPLLDAAASSFGVTLGSFFSSGVLFGLPLLCLGAVSPLLIGKLDSLKAGAGSAAGSLFLTNTIGGLIGGWLTALVLIPYLPLRLCLSGCGLALILVGSFWAIRLRRSLFASGAAPLAALLLFLLAPQPARSFYLDRVPSRIMESIQSSVGLIQVLDMGSNGRSLLLDGITQGGMDKDSGASIYEFTSYLDILSHRFMPGAKNVLLLGLGSGMLAKQLAFRGLDVSAAEIEPRMADIARRWFGMPETVKVIPMDARAFLRRSQQRFDIIFLDAFAGECSPWYLSTQEAFLSMKAHLDPGGVLLINTITREDGGSEGMDRLEAGLLERFSDVRVYVEHSDEAAGLVNAIVVAGDGLKATSEKFKGKMMERLRPKMEAILLRERRASRRGPATSDDFSDLDYAEADLRAEWRRLVIASLPPEVLGN